ncbi:8-oxoguanine deaminase [Kaistia dalseonensis]|uniref:8-oxoguanine deaminase n=2 Tax=Kaistia dalseonensis TaxID=410840 RepID=A0ABU0HAW9_9HYPH|nr:8-oxoguanine deaminase [Kaistia dalseonensis]MCX5496832.1 8-oxoguanine deaminase [Kaistia dalseonensis]MDQ0439458.1 8-oxoguanine deaminase [Kaistia dalseonensis]
MTERVWLKDPIAVLADGAERGIVVENGKIAELVGKGAEPTHPVHKVFDASKHVVTPGLVNTHHHMFQTLTRAHPAAINKELFPWLQALFPIWSKNVNPDNLRLATRLALTELLMSGCTTASDHQYLYPKGLDEAMDIQADEAGKLGVRMTLTRGSLNLTEAEGGNADQNAVQDTDTILADCERVINRYHDASEGAMLQVALAPCAPFNVTKRLMVETAELAAKCNCHMHTHLAETRDENAYCLEHFGYRPVDYLEEVGWMSDRVWLAHGIHFNDDEVKRLGKAGVGVSHCPTSNMVLASGQCRTKELEAAGSPVGLGVDGSASNDNSNLMEGIRHALMIGRLTYNAESVTHFDAFRWATEGSANCLGRKDIGAIAVGRQADMAFYSLDELRFSGAGDPLAALVLCGAYKADRVMVKGDWKVEDGAPIGVDLGQLRYEHGQAAKKFLEAI